MKTLRERPPYRHGVLPAGLLAGTCPAGRERGTSARELGRVDQLTWAGVSARIELMCRGSESSEFAGGDQTSRRRGAAVGENSLQNPSATTAEEHETSHEERHEEGMNKYIMRATP